MVRRSGQLERTRGHGARRSSLGPRGRGIFERLLSAVQPADRSPRREAFTLAFASGKGGTGKSFLATSLAVLLHGRGHGVTIVDCDFGLGCDHLLLGVKPDITLQQVVAGKATIEDVRLQTPAGPKLIPGASGVRQMANLGDRELQSLAREFGILAAAEEVLIFDVGAGISPQNVLTTLCADHVVLVTQPEIAALVDAYAVVKCLAQLDEKVQVSVVVNMVTKPGRGEQAFDRLREVSGRHVGVKLEFLGEVGVDPRITQHRLGQQPLVAIDPKCQTAKALEKIADRLNEVAGPLKPRVVPHDAGLEARFREHRLFL